MMNTLCNSHISLSVHDRMLSSILRERGAHGQADIMSSDEKIRRFSGDWGMSHSGRTHYHWQKQYFESSGKRAVGRTGKGKLGTRVTKDEDKSSSNMPHLNIRRWPGTQDQIHLTTQNAKTTFNSWPMISCNGVRNLPIESCNPVIQTRIHCHVWCSKW